MDRADQDKRTPGAILREARRRAGLTQVELSQRAGVAQSVISAYESDRREPGVRTFARLVGATGFELRFELTGSPAEPRKRPSERLREHRDEVLAIAEKYGAFNLRVFGSVARGEDTIDSDLDLLIDHGRPFGLLELDGLETEISELLGVDVDVVPAEGVKERMRERIFAEAVPL